MGRLPSLENRLATLAGQEVNKQLAQINPSALSELKREAGLGDKDFPSLTTEEKVCMNQLLNDDV